MNNLNSGLHRLKNLDLKRSPLKVLIFLIILLNTILIISNFIEIRNIQNLVYLEYISTNRQNLSNQELERSIQIESDKMYLRLIDYYLSEKNTTHFSKIIVGVYKPNTNDCEAFNFLNHNEIIWTKKDNCTPKTLDIRWIDHNIFIIEDTEPMFENCPSNKWIFKVISFNGENLILNHMNFERHLKEENRWVLYKQR